MGLLALVTIPIYIGSFDWMAWLMGALENDESGYARFSAASHAIALAVMLPTTFMAGMTLPLFTLVLIKRGGGEASIGRVYAANTLGAIAGVLFAVHIGLPQLGLKNLIVFGAMLDIVLGLVLLSRTSGKRGRSLQFGSVTSLAALALALGVAHLDPKLLASGVYRFGNTDTLASAEMLFYVDGKTASIALSEHANGALIVSTNGKSDAAIQADRSRPYAADEITMTMLGSLGLAYNPDSTRIANIGMGSGMTTHTVLAYNDVKSVDTVEIEPVMIEASRLFGDFVARAYEDPRSNIVIEDAKTFFSLHNRVYDLIIAEPSNPWVSGVASLFSTEFYERITTHLEVDGIFVQWMQVYEFNDGLAVSILKALSENFSDYIIYAVDDGNILLIARNTSPIGEPEWSALFESGLSTELAKVDIHSPADLQVRKITERSVADAYLQTQSVPANSDYYPFVDLHAGPARFARANAEVFSSWLLAPLPVLQMLNSEQLSFDDVTQTSYLSRLVYIATAQWLYRRLVEENVDEARTESGLTVPDDVASLALWLDEAARYCEKDFDLDRWFVYIQQLMMISLPYMSPEKGVGLIDAVDRSECEEQQYPLIRSWFELYRAVADRDAAAMATKGRELIEVMPADTPSAHRNYMLDAAVLGDIAQNRFPQAKAVWQQHAPEIYDTGPLPGHMQLLSAIALSERSKD